VTDDIETERAKYEKVYAFPGYGAKGHGAPIAHLIVPRAHGRGVLGDFGCGRGGSFQPYLDLGFTIQPVDHVDALDARWKGHPGVLQQRTANLWADELPSVDYGICTDVMEHIPESHVDATLANIAKAVKHGCLWTICHVHDVWGYKIQEKLHMTTKPNNWWVEQLSKHWKTVEVLRTQPGTSIYWTSHE